MTHRKDTAEEQAIAPGAHYGTTAQDYTAWYTALRATNISVA